MSHDIQKRKWGTFTYYGPDTRIITKLFRNSKIKVAYKIPNTIEHHLKSRDNALDIYSLSRIYQLKCNECPLKYVGQKSDIKNTFKP
jgi:hypothetical protein